MRYRDVELRYGCDRAALSPALRERFVELDLDEATRAWIDGCHDSPHGAAVLAARAIARKVMSDFDANGMLGVFDMRVLGRAQWRRLLGGGTHGRLLDVGAGDGAVTAELAPLFDEVVTTELSRPMARRLRARGWACHEVDLARSDVPGGPFDAVALLNLIDRTNLPITILERAAAALAPGGRLLVAAPLPLSPHVHVGSVTVDPDEALPADARTWEAAASELADLVLAPCGLEVRSLSRAPYLCRGGREQPVSILDDAVFVLGKAG